MSCFGRKSKTAEASRSMKEAAEASTVKGCETLDGAQLEQHNLERGKAEMGSGVMGVGEVGG